MNNYCLHVFYDGDCPLCRKEIALLRARDRDGAVLFTDLAGPAFSDQKLDKTYRELVASIHGKRPDGSHSCWVLVRTRMWTADVPACPRRVDQP